MPVLQEVKINLFMPGSSIPHSLTSISTLKIYPTPRTYSFLSPSSDIVICLYSPNIMLWYHPLKIGSHDSPKCTRLQFLGPIFWQISLNVLSLLSVLLISHKTRPSGYANHCDQRLVWPLNNAIWKLILPCLSELAASIWQVTTPWSTASFSSGVCHCPCFAFLPPFFGLGFEPACYYIV